MDENLALEQSISSLIAKVPFPVRDFILNDLPDTAHAIMERYSLHIDQGGALERELLLMLLGQETPETFVESLNAMQLDPATVTAIVADVNREVFTPLRKAERDGVREPQPPQPIQTQPQKPDPLPVPALVPPPSLPVAPAPVALPVPASSIPSPINVINSAPHQALAPIIQPAPALPVTLPGSSELVPEGKPVEVPVTWSAPIPKAETPTTQPPDVSVSQPEHREMRTMAKDMEMLKNGINPLANTTPEVPEAPKRAFQEEYVPIPLNLPHTPVPSASPFRKAPDMKNYGTDPYREPVE
ncbi:MAG: Phage Tail Collar [Parcubacteria group bacterium]|nr:Phage Tail Collar [Parcubacteria group bacterium]